MVILSQLLQHEGIPVHGRVLAAAERSGDPEHETGVGVHEGFPGGIALAGAGGGEKPRHVGRQVFRQGIGKARQPPRPRIGPA